MPDPATRYKELLGAAHSAAKAHSEHVRDRAMAIIGELADTDKEIRAATEDEGKVNAEIAGWWRRHVAASVTEVSWLSGETMPKPDPTADPAALEDYLASIEPATDAFKAAIRRASWGRRR